MFWRRKKKENGGRKEKKNTNNSNRERGREVQGYQGRRNLKGRFGQITKCAIYVIQSIIGPGNIRRTFKIEIKVP